MIWILSTFLPTMLALAVFARSAAYSEETRELEEIYADADVILKGALVSAEAGACTIDGNLAALYAFRGPSAPAGSVMNTTRRDIEVCGPTMPLIITYDYIVAAKWVDARMEELSVSSDAVVLASSDGRFYRTISNDSLQVSSDRGRAYAIAVEEGDYFERFQDDLNLSMPP